MFSSSTLPKTTNEGSSETYSVYSVCFPGSDANSSRSYVCPGCDNDNNWCFLREQPFGILLIVSYNNQTNYEVIYFLPIFARHYIVINISKYLTLSKVRDEWVKWN
jgi:hypothetical protein